MRAIPLISFQPEIGHPKPAPDTELVQVLCPECGFANSFWGRRDGKGNALNITVADVTDF